MPATIPCPNPNCGQMFAAETIQGTGKLACPRCGTVFQFRPGTTAPQQTAQIPVAQPVRPVPVPPLPAASPVVPARVPPPVPALPTTPVTATPPALVPTAAPMLDEGDEEEDEDEGRNGYRRERTPDPRLAFEDPAAEGEDPNSLVRRRRGRQPTWAKWLWLGPLLLTFTSTAIFLSWWYIRTVTKPDVTNKEEYVQGLENALYPIPARPWNRTQDDEARRVNARVRMKVNYVACRSDPSDAFALFYFDYKNRLPGENELVDIVLQKLRGYFTSIEWEKKEEGGILGGKKGLFLEFHAVDADGVPCSGEVYAVAHRGVGYWFFSWCPENLHDTAATEWEAMRGKFSFGTKREGWKETPLRSTTIPIPETRYQISYPDEYWEQRLESGWDMASRVTLVAYEREGKRNPLTDPRQRYSAKMAVCQMLRLPKVENLTAAVEAAKAYILEQQKKENENAVFQPVEEKKGKKPDGPADIGGVKGYVLHQELVPEPGGKKRLFLLAVVSDDEGVLVLEFECNAERSDYWEGEFAPVWKSLRAVKK